MSRSCSSRSRKQWFPQNRNPNSFLQSNEDFDTDCDPHDYYEDDSPPKRSSRVTTGVRKVSDPRDRQSQLDHNEQERGRRRELAIIYEMIRTCISEDDIRRHLDGAAKSADKLSYPQLLQISCGKIRDELHDLKVLDCLMDDIERLESYCDGIGIPIERKRPALSPMQRHKIVASVVDDVLKRDKESRNREGDYVMSQRARAMEAHNRLSELLEDENRMTSISQLGNYYSVASPQENRSVESSRRSLRRNQRRSLNPTRRNILRRRPTNISVPSPVETPAPPSSNGESILTPDILDRVVEEFDCPILEPVQHPAMITSTGSSPGVVELSDLDGFFGDKVEPISNDIALDIVQDLEFSAAFDDYTFDSLFSLVNSDGLYNPATP